MSNTYNVGWLRDNENQIFIPFTYTKSVKLDDEGHTLDATVTTVDDHTDKISAIEGVLEELKNGSTHVGVADSTKGTLTVGNSSFNGSTDVTITAKDLGITGALVYTGISTTVITDGGSENPTINGETISTDDLDKGSIVLYKNQNANIYQEFLWTGDSWELLGDEGSYALKTISIIAGNGLTGGGTLNSDFDINVNPDGVTIIINDDNKIAMNTSGVTAGNYGQSTNIDELQPEATSIFSIPYFTVDKYGRVTSASTKTIQIKTDTGLSNSISALEKREIIAGAGLTGGGDLTDSRTLNIIAGDGIQVNENSIQLATSGATAGIYGQSSIYSNGFDGSFTVPYITVDKYGRVTTIQSTTINMPSDDELVDAINTLRTDTSTDLNTVKDNLQNQINTNKSNIESNDTDIASLQNRMDDCESNIEGINQLDIEQNDNITTLQNDVVTLDTRTKYMDASAPDGFHIVNEDGEVGFLFDTEGIAKAYDFVATSSSDNISLRETKSELDIEIADRLEDQQEITDILTKMNITAGTPTKPIYFNEGTPTQCDDKLEVDISGNADSASKLTTEEVGDEKQPVYFDDGIPVICEGNFTFYEVMEDGVDTSTGAALCVLKSGDTMTGPLVGTGFVGPLTGNATSADKLNTNAGSSTVPVYFANGIPVACDNIVLPTGGDAGQVLIKNSTTDGDASWKELVALPKGGTEGQVLLKSSSTDGDATWATNAPIATKLATAQTFSLTGDVTGSATFDGSAACSITTVVTDNSHNHTWSNISDRTTCTISTSGTITASAVYGAVWNDYAEYRESDCEEFGYVLMENGDDTLSKTTERLSHFAGVSSDTWGFSQGETTRAHTPIAVAGRVLVYTYQNRDNYKPGDCVCAAPNGTVDIMTREEIINWPDRIVGTVSCVPTYKEWGSNNTDRGPVKVNNRIWIKVR